MTGSLVYRDSINRENTKVLKKVENNAFNYIILSVVFFIGAFSVYGGNGKGKDKNC